MTQSEMLIARLMLAIDEEDYEAVVDAALTMASEYQTLMKQALAMDAAIHRMAKLLELNT